MSDAARILDDVRAVSKQRWTEEREKQLKFDPGDRSPEAPSSDQPDTSLNLPDEYWTARPILERIRDAAWSRMVSPDAVLIAFLARLAALIPPTTRLPATVGSLGTFDFIGSVVGSSSAGKSIAGDVAADLLPTTRTDVLLDLPVGSGEGLAQSFFVPERGDDGKPTGKQIIGINAVHFSIDEGTALMEQQSRSGTTIVQTLCSAWSGRAIGQANARSDTRRIIPARRVRVAAVVNMQTANGHLILDDKMQAIGLPQRVTFATAHDPSMPPPSDLPDWPGPITFRAPTMITNGSVLDVAPRIVEEIQEHRHAITSGAKDEPALDGHLGLMRLKIAGLLAVIEDRDEVATEDWELANTNTTVSTRIRDRLIAVKQADDAIKKRRAADGRAEFEGHVDDIKERKAVARLTDSIERHVRNAGDDGVGRADVRRSTTSSSTRHRFEEALTQAKQRGAVTEVDGRLYAN